MVGSCVISHIRFYRINKKFIINIYYYHSEYNVFETQLIYFVKKIKKIKKKKKKNIKKKKKKFKISANYWNFKYIKKIKVGQRNFINSTNGIQHLVNFLQRNRKNKFIKFLKIKKILNILLKKNILKKKSIKFFNNLKERFKNLEYLESDLLFNSILKKEVIKFYTIKKFYEKKKIKKINLKKKIKKRRFKNFFKNKIGLLQNKFFILKLKCKYIKKKIRVLRKKKQNLIISNLKFFDKKFLKRIKRLKKLRRYRKNFGKKRTLKKQNFNFLRNKKKKSKKRIKKKKFKKLNKKRKLIFKKKLTYIFLKRLVQKIFYKHNIYYKNFIKKVQLNLFIRKYMLKNILKILKYSNLKYKNKLLFLKINNLIKRIRFINHLKKKIKYKNIKIKKKLKSKKISINIKKLKRWEYLKKVSIKRKERKIFNFVKYLNQIKFKFFTKYFLYNLYFFCIKKLFDKNLKYLSTSKSLINLNYEFNIYRIDLKFITASVINQYLKAALSANYTLMQSIRPVLMDLNKRIYLGDLSGFKIAFSGRFKRTQMATYFWRKNGKLGTGSAIFDIDYDFSILKTKYGVCALKIWLSKENGLFKTYRKIYPFSNPFFIKIQKLLYKGFKLTYLELSLNKFYIKYLFKDIFVGHNSFKKNFYKNFLKDILYKYIYINIFLKNSYSLKYVNRIFLPQYLNYKINYFSLYYKLNTIIIIPLLNIQYLKRINLRSSYKLRFFNKLKYRLKTYKYKIFLN